MYTQVIYNLHGSNRIQNAQLLQKIQTEKRDEERKKQSESIHFFCCCWFLKIYDFGFKQNVFANLDVSCVSQTK